MLKNASFLGAAFFYLPTRCSVSLGAAQRPQDPSDATGKKKEFAFQNSWGITQRTIGVMAMVHGDDKGLVLPPRVAAFQVVIVPVGLKANSSEAEREEVRLKCMEYFGKLSSAGVRVKLDESDHSPGPEPRCPATSLGKVRGCQIVASIGGSTRASARVAAHNFRVQAPVKHILHVATRVDAPSPTSPRFRSHRSGGARARTALRSGLYSAAAAPAWVSTRQPVVVWRSARASLGNCVLAGSAMRQGGNDAHPSSSGSEAWDSTPEATPSPGPGPVHKSHHVTRVRREHVHPMRPSCAMWRQPAWPSDARRGAYLYAGVGLG